MRNKLLVLGFISVATLSCGKKKDSATGNGSGSGKFTFTGAAMSALPSVINPATLNSLKAPICSRERSADNLADVASSEPLHMVTQFVKLECHMIPQANFCPAQLDTNGDGVLEDYTPAPYDNFKFSATTLIGLIYHADMYQGNFYRSDEGYKT